MRSGATAIDQVGQPGGRVLLVDDDEIVSQAHAQALTGAGWIVVENDSTARQAATRSGGLRCDRDGPGHAGDDRSRLLRVVRDHDLGVPVIILMGRPDLQSAMVDEGAVSRCCWASRRASSHGRESRSVPNPRARDEQERFVFENRGQSGVEPDKWISLRIGLPAAAGLVLQRAGESAVQFFPRPWNRIE